MIVPAAKVTPIGDGVLISSKIEVAVVDTASAAFQTYAVLSGLTVLT
jgi:hypothetical protein